MNGKMMLKSFHMAIKSIFASKMRSFLTMLGIIIGIVSLVVMVSLVEGATASVTDEIENMGSDLLTISIMDDKQKPIKLEDLPLIAESESIGQVAPLGQSSVIMKTETNEEVVTLYGTTPSFSDIQGLELSSGRFIKTTDVDNSSYVAVLSYDVADELYGSTNIIGESIVLGGRLFQVVGVLEESDAMSTGMISEMGVYVPYTVESRMSSTSSITNLYVSSAVDFSSETTEKSIETTLAGRFDGDTEAFSITNMDSISSTMTSVTDTLTYLLAGIAAISLLVGGIGIMNIMLVSVTERTKEIGIRKAIGANRENILLQFLIEALVISLLGCLIGIAFSWVSLEVVQIVLGDSMQVSLSMGIVLLAITFSAAIGIIFGMYPANKASKKPPIEALRYQD